MQSITILLIIAATIGALIAALLDFRFLLYPLIPSLNPTLQRTQLSLRGRTLFISDLHLEANRPFVYAKDLRNFIEDRNISNLIVNGDLFNSRDDALAILQDKENNLVKRLGLDGLEVDLFWVLGTPGHDLPYPTTEVGGLLPIHVLGNCVSVDLGHAEILVYHGHDLSTKGAIGHGWNRFISRLSLEKAWKKFANVDVDTWVFFGHTHIPGIDRASRVANSGGWQKVPFVKPTKTGLLMSECQGAPELVAIA